MATMTLTRSMSIPALPSVPQMEQSRRSPPSTRPTTRRRNSLTSSAGSESVCSGRSATTTQTTAKKQRPSLMGRPGSRSMRNSRRQMLARNAMQRNSQKSITAATEQHAPPTTRGVKPSKSFGSRSLRNLMSNNDTPNQAPPTTRGVKANKSFGAGSKSMRNVTNDTAQAPPSTRGVKPNKTFGGSTRSMSVEPQQQAPAPPSTRGVKKNRTFGSSKSMRNMSSTCTTTTEAPPQAPPSTRGTAPPSTRRGLQASKSFGAGNSSSLRSVVPGLPAIPAMASRSVSPTGGSRSQSVVLPPVPSMVSRNAGCQSERNLMTARPRLGVMNKPVVSRSMRSFGGKSSKSLRGSRRAKLTLMQPGSTKGSQKSMTSIKSRASQCSLLFHIDEDEDDDLSKYAFSVCSEEKPHYKKNNSSGESEEDEEPQEDDAENEFDALELEFGGELGEVDDDQECTVALTLDDDTVYMCSLRSIPQWIMMEQPEEKKEVAKHHEGAIPKNGHNLNIPQEISIVFDEEEEDGDQAENATIITMDPHLRDFNEQEHDDDSVRVCGDTTSSFRICSVKPRQTQAQVQPVMPPPVQQGYQNTRSSRGSPTRSSGKGTKNNGAQPQAAPMMNRRKSLMQSFGIKKIMFSWRKKDPAMQPSVPATTHKQPAMRPHHKMMTQDSAHTQDTTASYEDSELTFNTTSMTSF